MFEITIYETKKRLKGVLVLIVGLSFLIGLYVWIFPSIEASGIDLEKYTETFPPALREAFGLRALGTIEGYLSSELYSFGWVLLLGLYFAYSASSTIAGYIEDERMDILLSLPISRVRLLGEKFASLFTPLILINVLTLIILYIGLIAIGESINVIDLIAVHALSIPYLLTCAGIGLLMSVMFNRESLAQRSAMGLVFGLFLVESIVLTTDYEEIGVISPTHYYDPSAILIDSNYDVMGAAVLLVATAVLVVVSALWFRRKDIE